jgi:DNA (cytosine-5)-methyltransferase 1
MANLVLSIFPGIGMLDRAFEQEGFCLVRGPDLLWGGDIKEFHAPAGTFDGVIGGPPCQAFSRLVAVIRHRGHRIAANLIPEFERVVAEAQPRWWIMENVDRAPLPSVPGYRVDPTLLNNRWLGQEQNRLHRFSFGTRDGRRLRYDVVRVEALAYEPRVCASGVTKPGADRRRSHRLKYLGWKTRAALAIALKFQGLPANFLDRAPFTIQGKIAAVGNGVPLPVGREVARAVHRALAEG